jgi:hypothetical protein
LVEARLKQAGMRWSVAGSHAIAGLRAVHRSGRWAAFWQTHPARQTLAPRVPAPAPGAASAPAARPSAAAMPPAAARPPCVAAHADAARSAPRPKPTPAQRPLILPRSA